MEVASRILLGTRSFFVRTFVFAVLTAALGSNIFAQSTATLGGTVTDATGAVAANAEAVATNQATGVETATQTDSAVPHFLPSLPIATNRIQATPQGFQSSTISNS